MAGLGLVFLAKRHRYGLHIPRHVPLPALIIGDSFVDLWVPCTFDGLARRHKGICRASSDVLGTPSACWDRFQDDGHIYAL